MAEVTAVGSSSFGPKITPAKTIRFLVHWRGRRERTSAVTTDVERTRSAAGAGRTGLVEEAGLRAMRGARTPHSWRYEKLLIASASESNVSNTVRSLVMESRSVMRFVR